jgi:hypothetical protein
MTPSAFARIAPTRVGRASTGWDAMEAVREAAGPECSGLRRGTITPLFTPTGRDHLGPRSSGWKRVGSQTAQKSRRKRYGRRTVTPFAKVDVEGSNPFSRSTNSRRR